MKPRRARTIITGMFMTFYFCGSLSHAMNDSSVLIKWGYRGNIGPERWAQLDSSFLLCAHGRLQSPISIEKNTKPLKDGLRINYSSAPLSEVNNGTTVLTLGNEQLLLADGLGIQANFPTDANQNIQFDNQSYQLVQFHIHTPSENLWQGQSYPLEIHFVHQGDNGKVIIIGVLAKGGSPNSELQKVIDHLPKEKNKSITVGGETIDPSKLLPATLNYYSFPGSLTIPPCKEGVQWIVMQESITVSPAQIIRLKRAAGGNNARPAQPLNGRVVNAVTYLSECSGINDPSRRSLRGLLRTKKHLSEIKI